jgi:hypothetical protein
MADKRPQSNRPQTKIIHPSKVEKRGGYGGSGEGRPKVPQNVKPSTNPPKPKKD